MPNDERFLTTHDSVVLNKIASYVCQAIIVIQERQPELLLEKYRNIPWQSYPNQSALKAKFTDVLSQTKNWDELVQRLQGYLKVLLVPESFNSPLLVNLVAKIYRLNPAKAQLNGSSSTNIQKIGIAILLLDAENLQINPDTEKFLTTVCTHPIQVKIAFANWYNRGKLDVELHQRGYDLIHVPAGRDNADGKMIAFGSSIYERYPAAKEVLVCSSDKVMTNLCNHLQQHGLTVYQVSQHGENITVLNSHTGEVINQVTNSVVDIPSMEIFIQQIKELIRSEQKHTGKFWIKMDTVSKLFKNKYNYTITQVASKYLSGKPARDIFINYRTDLVVHQVDEASELYITLFEINQSPAANDDDEPQPNISTSNLLTSISSSDDLEQVIKNLLNELTAKSSSEYINVGILGGQFKQRYGKPITEQIKSLQISGNFLKFLQSSSSFRLQQINQGWEVAIR